MRWRTFRPRGRDEIKAHAFVAAAADDERSLCGHVSLDQTVGDAPTDQLRCHPCWYIVHKMQTKKGPIE